MNSFDDHSQDQEVAFKVIRELVNFYQDMEEPRELVWLIDALPDRIGANFFRQVSKDLHTDKYDGISASEFRQFLVDEYRREYEEKTRADFDALGKQMASTTIRAELVELGRKRAKLAPHTGISYTYINHCWACKGPISSDVHARCPSCNFYICSCGECLCGWLT